MFSESAKPRLLSSALVAIALLLLGASPAALGQTPTEVPATCGKPLLERPSELILACGDAGLQADRLTWRTWGGRRSVADGRITEKVCKPDCASGRVRHHQGEVILTVRVNCGGYYSYERAKVRWGGRTHWDERWVGCSA
jgi:hypothetical protein